MYTVQAMAFKPDLLFDEDWPEFDEDFHDLLTLGAASEALPSFGKPQYALILGAKFEKRLSMYQTLVDPKPNLMLQAADVHAGATGLPRTPWIKGVSRGYADAQ